MRRSLLAVLLAGAFGMLGVGGSSIACGTSPPPTSTTPPMEGSAAILPSPVTAEFVPKGGPEDAGRLAEAGR